MKITMIWPAILFIAGCGSIAAQIKSQEATQPIKAITKVAEKEETEYDKLCAVASRLVLETALDLNGQGDGSIYGAKIDSCLTIEGQPNYSMAIYHVTKSSKNEPTKSYNAYMLFVKVDNGWHLMEDNHLVYWDEHGYFLVPTKIN